MPKLELNPAALADADKGEAFIRRNVPPAVQEFIDALSQQEADIGSQVRADIDTRERLNREVQDAEFRLRNAESKAREFDKPTAANRDHVEALRAMVEAAEARAKSHETKIEKRKAALTAQSRGRGIYAVDKFQSHAVNYWYKPHRDTPHAPLPESDITVEFLEGIRRKTDTAYAGIKAAQSAPLPAHEGFAPFKAVVERDLKKFSDGTGLGGFLRVTYDEQGRVMPSSATLDIERLAVRACREMILSYGENRLREIADLHSFNGDKPLSHAARKTKIAKLRSEIDKLEIEEGRVLRALAAKGVFVPLRGNTVSINAVLGIEPDREAIARRKAEAEAAAKAA